MGDLTIRDALCARKSSYDDALSPASVAASLEPYFAVHDVRPCAECRQRQCRAMLTVSGMPVVQKSPSAGAPEAAGEAPCGGEGDLMS